MASDLDRYGGCYNPILFKSAANEGFTKTSSFWQAFCPQAGKNADSLPTNSVLCIFVILRCVFRTLKELKSLVGVLLFTFSCFVLVERINNFRADIVNILWLKMWPLVNSLCYFFPHFTQLLQRSRTAPEERLSSHDMSSINLWLMTVLGLCYETVSATDPKWSLVCPGCECVCLRGI